MLEPSKEQRAARHASVQHMIDILNQLRAVEPILGIEAVQQGVLMLYQDVLEAEGADPRNYPFDTVTNEFKGDLGEWVENDEVVLSA